MSAAVAVAPTRRSMPSERPSITHKFQIGQHEGYVTAGLYEDGTLGEIFLWGFGKDGSFVQCMMGVWAKSMSNAIGYGQPVHKLVTNYLDVRFEPYGATGNPEIPDAKSIPDYLARWLALRFLTEEERKEHGINVYPGGISS